MTIQEQKALKKAMTNPGKFFTSPDDVLTDDRFSPEEKIKILDSWSVDANGLIRAEEENMQADTSKPKAAQLLQHIGKTREKIESSLS